MCDVGDWGESGIPGKIAIAFFAPVYLFCRWTVPVLPLDRNRDFECIRAIGVDLQPAPI